MAHFFIALATALFLLDAIVYWFFTLTNKRLVVSQNACGVAAMVNSAIAVLGIVIIVIGA